MRHKAAEIAALASEGLITTAVRGGYSRKWRLTARGLALLENQNDA